MRAMDTAAMIVDRFADAAAIDTADAEICGFILAAARLAIADPETARKVEEMMSRDES